MATFILVLLAIAVAYMLGQQNTIIKHLEKNESNFQSEETSDEVKDKHWLGRKALQYTAGIIGFDEYMKALDEMNESKLDLSNLESKLDLSNFEISEPGLLNTHRNRESDMEKFRQTDYSDILKRSINASEERKKDNGGRSFEGENFSRMVSEISENIEKTSNVDTLNRPYMTIPIKFNTFK